MPVGDKLENSVSSNMRKLETNNDRNQTQLKRSGPKQTTSIHSTDIFYHDKEKSVNERCKLLCSSTKTKHQIGSVKDEVVRKILANDIHRDKAAECPTSNDLDKSNLSQIESSFENLSMNKDKLVETRLERNNDAEYSDLSEESCSLSPLNTKYPSDLSEKSCSLSPLNTKQPYPKAQMNKLVKCRRRVALVIRTRCNDPISLMSKVDNLQPKDPLNLVEPNFERSLPPKTPNPKKRRDMSPAGDDKISFIPKTDLSSD